MGLLKDQNGYNVQVFTIRGGLTIPITYIPTEDETLILGADVDITVDGITISYALGTPLGFARDTFYTLSVATPAHKM